MLRVHLRLERDIHLTCSSVTLLVYNSDFVGHASLVRQSPDLRICQYLLDHPFDLRGVAPDNDEIVDVGREDRHALIISLVAA